MLEIQLIRYLFAMLTARLAQARLNPDQGDVAEKIVIVGIFVALAITVGALVTHAVRGDATRIAHSIAGAP